MAERRKKNISSGLQTELKAALKTLQDQLAALNNIRSNADMTLEHIKVIIPSLLTLITHAYVNNLLY